MAMPLLCGLTKKKKKKNEKKKKDLLSFETKVVRNVSEGLSAIGWHSTKARQIANDDAELLLGSATGAYVLGVKKLGRPTGEVVRNYTAASTKGWPAKALPGVRAFGVEPSSGKLYAVTCVKDGGEDAFWVYDEWRGQFCKVGEGYGCLGHNIVFNADDTVYAVSVEKRQVVRLWSGYPTVVANFTADVVPTSIGSDSTGRLFVGANRVNYNQREAEVYTVDVKTGELQLVAAVGGAQLDTLLVTPDDRVFFTDPAHDAVHEVVLGSRFLDNELRLIRNGNLVSGGRHPGAASSTAHKYGHAAFRTEMLTGQEDLATAGGAAAWTTPDGTDLVLLADTYQLKSLTADRFVDSWPLPLAEGAPTRFVRARNVYVAPTRAAPAHEPHAVLVSDWARSEVHLLSPFAPHEGDFEVDASITSRLVEPYGVALTADGTVLVADFTTGEVTAHAVGAAAPVVIASGLDGPVGLALAPEDENGTAVFVTEYKAGRVVRIERANGERTVVAGNLSWPEGIAVSPLDGRLTVLESGGDRRLLSIDAETGDVRVVASQLSSAGDSSDGHPGAFASVAWTQARVLDGELEFGARSAAALYVALEGSLRRYEVVQRADDPYHKPTDPALFHVQVPARDETGRNVVTISLFDETLPAPFAVAAGTWLRFRAFRQDEVHNGVHAPSNTRLLNSDIPGFPSTRLYPASAGSKSGATQPTGPSELLVELASRAPTTCATTSTATPTRP
jgi:DNA-binding beta-propeller fold protein YncE